MADGLKAELEATGLGIYCLVIQTDTDLFAGNENLLGALHHWNMVIKLREYLFQVCFISQILKSIVLTCGALVRCCYLASGSLVAHFPPPRIARPGCPQLDDVRLSC